ncbi:bifunctional phosphoribosyl-AMP cyclohydrolase/phosphoribosyl-ATP diphosphatase HisIE [Blochmannia endosymbiont of Colobopsis nipponica]|uniref:bifunctional phosphoribosyl-AMP cyclohydrolase/phosphoribosyl-ATP diphosphatase HisIE n=1 Tax=Blochmannia endosymbiont of Colobopsis nipponica TaxID=2681987 RepID=UPI0017855161|nr:bifunctional phosphoribosyl-AMP cyclohydrolase/phosphoribosyl-ATP diphosphatase HisIE [Blochmannia endosymbiont of Colobopsis nipponica]QOI10993.1 bifunctional phosphoribosyl-AMP cyclohydrolase/phosphoribosyl-ATP diphosphatase HisIE [Blochmannia endosymbiont of Colobopsis nipponica]
MIIKKEQDQKDNCQETNKLTPVIIQNVMSGEVLMLGYMNQEALQTTKKSGYVTFFSRKKKCLWTKGETSGNKLKLINLYQDCDKDTLLILALPSGPTCHHGTSSCFHPAVSNGTFLFQLEQILSERKSLNLKNSYTARLFTKGSKYIAQKVGEEGIEVALAAATKNKEETLNESADLIYHLLVLLKATSLNLNEVIKKLKMRNNNPLI